MTAEAATNLAEYIDTLRRERDVLYAKLNAQEAATTLSADANWRAAKIREAAAIQRAENAEAFLRDLRKDILFAIAKLPHEGRTLNTNGTMKHPCNADCGRCILENKYYGQ